MMLVEISGQASRAVTSAGRCGALRQCAAAFVALATTLGGVAASADGDAAAGEKLAAACAACHGADGNTPLLPEYPKLGGQNAKYTLAQLRMIKSKERDIALMAGQLDNMSDDDLKDISAYYASLAPPRGAAEGDDDSLLSAELMYRGGDLDRQIAACAACHSPRGNGNSLAGFPMISGQSAGYTIAQLTAYREGHRETDEAYGGMMRSVAAKLKDHEIKALADLLQGLQ